jgi:hypothetical protein
MAQPLIAPMIGFTELPHAAKVLGIGAPRIDYAGGRFSR